jgi:hypothetical protein
MIFETILVGHGTLDDTSFLRSVVRLDAYCENASEPNYPYLSINVLRPETAESSPFTIDTLLLPRLRLQLRFEQIQQTTSASKDRATKPGRPNHTGRKVSPLIDLDYIASLIEECEVGHGSRCEPFHLHGTDNAPRQLCVLDVEALTVVEAPVDCVYYALSYVWGGISPPWPELKATGSRFVRDYSPKWNEVPRTIRDAVCLVRRLRGKYIWVDSMCIDQKNEQEMKEQIGQMDKIYAGARLTIVAAAGRDAQAGISGVNSSYGVRWQRTEPLSATCSIITALPHDQIRPHSRAGIINSSCWNERGWTYQERILSRRCLIVTDYQAYFACPASFRSEDCLLSREDPESLTSLRSPGTSRVARLKSLAAWVNFIWEFCDRKFTFDADAVCASTPALRVLSRIMETEMICGLPEALFQRAMLWYVDYDVRKSTAGVERQGVPSWSWLSWRGRIFCAKNLLGLESCVSWYRLRKEGMLCAIKSSRVRSTTPICGNGEERKPEWLTEEFDSAWTIHRASILCSYGADLGDTTCILVGWAVTLSVELVLSAFSENDEGKRYVLCDIVFSGEDVPRNQDRPVFISRNWWDANPSKLCSAVLIGYFGKGAGMTAHVILTDLLLGSPVRRIGTSEIRRTDWDFAVQKRWEVVYLM